MVYYMSNKFRGEVQEALEFASGQFDNPESLLSKLADPHQYSSLQECQLLLQTLKEGCSFEKAFIRKTASVCIPRSAQLVRAHSQDYRNYQKLLAYSRRKRDVVDFQRKFGSNKQEPNKLQKLAHIVCQRKARLLTEELSQGANEATVENLLKDDEQRSALFTETLLLERHYAQKLQNRLPRSRKPIPLQAVPPKHLRLIEQTKGMDDYWRRMKVARQNQCGTSKKLEAASSSQLRKKRAENTIVVADLLQHYGTQLDVHAQHNWQLQTVRRLFLCYASSQSQPAYHHILPQSASKFISDFNLPTPPPVQALLKKPSLDLLLFSELLHELSLIEGSSFHSDVSLFLKTHIVPYPQRFQPPQYFLYQTERQMIDQTIKRSHLLVRLSRICPTKEGWVGQHQLVETMWMLKQYPVHVSRQKLHFYFLFVRTGEKGLTLAQLAQICMLVALTHPGEAVKNVQQTIKTIAKLSRSRPN